MADSLFSILSSRDYDEPPESKAIKQYVQKCYKQTVAVTVRERDILIEVRGSSFAGALRMQTRQLQQAANTDKKLIFRIA